MDIDVAVAGGDLDELLRVIDRCWAAHDWEGLVELRRKTAHASEERGLQLWPITVRAEYLLALEAPAEVAATVLEEGAGHFAPGPLPEVAAARHTWAELAPHLGAGAPAVLTLHERVVRGEDCSEGSLPGPPVLELPRHLLAWEPEYAVALYEPDGVHAPAPELPPRRPVALGAPVPAEHDDVTTALVDLVAAWTEGSDGRAEAVAVTGAAPDAIAALGAPTARMASLTRAEALALTGWAAASGGAHARRRGAAAGRFAAWWLLACLARRHHDWPVDPDHPAPGELTPEELDDATTALTWWVWDAHEPPSGWELRIAIEDPSRGRAWAIAASDAAAP